MTRSPNFNVRPKNTIINTLVMHYTGMETAEAALSRLCDPDAEVSSHYMIDLSGKVYELVDEQDRAWHAGVSSWRGKSNVNDVSIGIELVNLGHEFGYHAFPEAQITALIELSHSILQRHPIEARNVIAHSDIAPDRKKDPGELFDWKRLAKEHIGLWVDSDNASTQVIYSLGDQGKEVEQLQQRLIEYGYLLTHDGVYGSYTANVVTAFKRHFCPNNVNAVWDQQAEDSLNGLFQLI